MPTLDNIDLTNISKYVRPFLDEHLEELKAIRETEPTSILALAILRYMAEHTDSDRRIRVSARDCQDLLPVSATYLAALIAQLQRQQFIIESHPYGDHRYSLHPLISFKPINGEPKT